MIHRRFGAPFAFVTSLPPLAGTNLSLTADGLRDHQAALKQSAREAQAVLKDSGVLGEHPRVNR